MRGRTNRIEFGVDYYPDQWPRDMWERDFERIRNMGAQSVRMMEFAWAILEPERGRFDFALFDDAIACAANCGLSVVLGTPTATIPIWLYRSAPSVMQIHPSGGSRPFGIRRQPCYNAPAYRDACTQIVRAVGEHFGANPAVVGWQIDNEIGHEGSDRCVCEHCRAQWTEWLRATYGIPAAMNEAWGTVFWSQTYASFDDVELPASDMHLAHNPGLLLDYHRFMSDSAVRHASAQADILRTYIPDSVWISTNLYAPPTGTVIDMEDLNAKMDFPGYDNYPVWGDMDEPLPWYFNAYALSYIRGLKDTGNYTIFEQISGFQGHTCLGYRPNEKEMISFTHQAIALGADRLFYFRWRTAAWAQEQLCSGILDTDNEDNDRLRAITCNIATRSAEYNRFAHLPFEAQACLVYDRDNSRLVKFQHLSRGLKRHIGMIAEAGYDQEMTRSFAPFSVFGVNADVKSARSVDLSRYRIISLNVYQMTDPAFVRRLEAWVQEGGTLILGWRTGARTTNNHNSAKALPGEFSQLSGVRISASESLNETRVGVRIGCIPVQGEVWADVLEPVTARVLARYSGKKKFYAGKPAITENRYGAGRVFYVGTSLNPAGVFLLYRSLFRKAGVPHRFAGLGLEVVRRRCQDGSEVEVVVNHTDRAKWYRCNRIPAWDFTLLPL